MNIDYKLDLYNKIKDYQEFANENDSLLVIQHNPIVGDAFLVIHGEIENLAALFCIKDYIQHDDPNDLQCHNSVKVAILNIAVNMINNDVNIKEAFIKALKLKPIE